MITIKKRGTVQQIQTDTGDMAFASSTFEVTIAIQHLSGERHGPQCCPFCREEKRTAERFDRRDLALGAVAA